LSFHRLCSLTPCLPHQPGMRTVCALLLLAAPGAGLHVQKEECACIPWKHVYADDGLRCGQGYECAADGATFKMAKDKLPQAGLEAEDMNKPEFDWSSKHFYGEWCTNFYRRASFSRCLNKKSFEYGAPREQWCYVHQECQEAEPVEGTAFAIKTCSEQDALASVATPEELNKITAADGLDLRTLVPASYVVEKERWSAVEAASGLSEAQLNLTHSIEIDQGLKRGERLPWTEAGAAKMKKIRESGINTLFIASDYRAGGVVVAGAKTYTVMLRPNFELVCVGGCDA